jgi:creatinine amidohydrolase/Fe(II)-dependent formamide hydrolase-like protein
VDWEIEGHGGITETSLNLLVKEETVHMERAVDELEARYVHNFGSIKGWGPGVFPEVTADWAEKGHYGRATLASVEIGKVIFENRVKSLVEHIEYMKEFEVKPINPYK